MKPHYRRPLNRTALLGVLVLVALFMATGAAWAQPNPLPLDPANLPAGTEAFISQTLSTQLRGVEEPGNPGDPSGLNFQNIGAPAGFEYNNIAYDPGSPNRDGGYIYAVGIFGEGTGGGNLGLLRIGEDGSGNIVIQPLGYPGYDPNRDCETASESTGSTDARMCGTGQYYPRYDAGDIDTDTGKFHVLTQGQVLANAGNTCGTNPSVCTDRVRSFDLDTVWSLVPPGAAPADLSSAYGVSRIFRNPVTNSLYVASSEEADARVADWAYRDGKLYGGDANSGRLAVITANAADDDSDPSNDATPAYFELFSFDPAGEAPSLDTTVPFTADAYGAAWFIGDILYLYKNGGENNVAPKVYKIDLQTDSSGIPKIIEVVETVDVVTRNDGASFMAQGSELFVCTDTAYVIQGLGGGAFVEQSWLTEIDQTQDPFEFNQIPDASTIYPGRINNLAFYEGLLYGWRIATTGPPVSAGLVSIDALGNLTFTAVPDMPTSSDYSDPGGRPESSNLNAGDVDPANGILYLTDSGGGAPNGNPNLYAIDLTTGLLVSGYPIEIRDADNTDVRPSGKVNDFAFKDGLLYGGDQDEGELAILDPVTGYREDIPLPGLPTDPANGAIRYGGAYFRPDGTLHLYENNVIGGIYPVINPTSATPTLGIFIDGPNSVDVDAASCAAVEPAPAIEIQKTVYWGHDSGASAASAGELVIGENGDPVTYVFTVTNTGDTYLGSIMIDDALLNIVDSIGLVLLSGSEPLAPNGSLVYYYEAAISGDLTNTAAASGNPVDESGDDIPDLPDPMDEDTAEVQEAASGIDIQKTVYAGHDSGLSAPGGELVEAADGSAVTYVFTVTNTGETYLDDITIVDADLGIDRSDLTLLSGSEPLAPLATLVFYYEGYMNGDLLNTASTSGNPVDENGVDLPGFENPMASDTARVDVLVPGIELQKTVYAGHNSGGSAPGVDVLEAPNGSEVTYVFAVTNTGDTHLSDITIVDSDLVIPEFELMLLSGFVPLAPGESLVYYYETFIDGDLLNTASTSGNPVDENGADRPGFVDPTDDDTAQVQIQTTLVSVLKLTNGVADPNTNWMFAVYDGPNASNGSSFLTSPLASASTSGVEDGVIEFATELDITATYTLCEMGLPGGWSATWMIDTTGNGSAEMTIIPYNPNVSDPEDLGNDCFDLGAGTSYELSADSVLVFEVNNIPPPGGQARTPGYWKNWSSCSGGGQYARTTYDVDPNNEFVSLDEVLNDPGVYWGSFDILSCEDAVSILDQRDLKSGKKKANDAAYTLAMHLLAYQLNEAAGAYGCSEAQRAAVTAENFLAAIDFDGMGSYLRPKHGDYQMALDLAETLDMYNNNNNNELLCN